MQTTSLSDIFGSGDNTSKVLYNIKLCKTSGRIVYEYNPLHNYRRMHIGNDDEDENNPDGTITDLVTTQLNFDLKHPVEINCLHSYDGTINLILNDNKNIPRLINTRFTVRQNNTYEVIDRIGSNDTNIYDENQFDLDTSLYKRINTIPELTYKGIPLGGNLKVGNYVLYIKYSDADDNETDFVAESGTISCFIGNDGDPSSIKGGYSDENSNKQIHMYISNIDSNYDYIKVYYTRSTSDVDLNRYTHAYKIIQKYPVHNSQCDLLITGNEAVEDIPLSELNIRYFIAESVKTQAECQNRLFVGNVVKEECDYADLLDLSLRIIPSIVQNEAQSFIGKVDKNYNSVVGSNTGEYYNSKNIYYKVGYWNEELYRFGVVYILNSGLLSPVFNITGCQELTTTLSSYPYDKGVFNGTTRYYLQIDEDTQQVEHLPLYNAKGVSRIKVEANNPYEVLGIRFNIPQDVVSYLKGKIKGLFFVRLKRIPTKMCLMYLMPHDSYSGLPQINYDSKIYYESFINQTASNRILTHDYQKRLAESPGASITSFIGICPESELALAKFNQIFTGSEIPVKISTNSDQAKSSLTRDTYFKRHYYTNTGNVLHSTNFIKAKLANVPDAAPLIVIDDTRFRASAGEATLANKFLYIGSKNPKTKALNIVRGNYGPYVGVLGTGLDYGQMYDVYAPGFKESNISKQFELRYEDSSEYMAIGDRIQIDKIPRKFSTGSIGSTQIYQIDQYRGDCYICNFTHRLNRNFQDPSAPINDMIIDSKTWKDNYDVDDSVKSGKINRGDVNAVQLGSWITIKVYASRNLSLRTEDLSYPTEQGMNGHPRGFYPYLSLSVEGNYKIPESGVLNDGFGASLGERWNYTLPNAPYFKNVFLTRVYYSDISVTDSFKNGYRVFRENNYRDYPTTYGGLMKLVTCKNSIIAIFEHGVCLLPVNERTQVADSVGGSVFINTNNVLPENPSSIISDEFGTQWPDSVIKTPKAIYGVDTVAKKIWQISLTDLTLNCISDFKVLQFLNQHITLDEFQLDPIIGVRNVKTHYNRFKQDIMFTFYNHTYTYEEEVWNLCFNELTSKFLTFYSWLPSFSENIDNMFFSFNRDTSKWFAKLATSTTSNALADGITINNTKVTTNLFTGILSLSNRSYPTDSDPTDSETISLEYTLLLDPWKNYEKFHISGNTLSSTLALSVFTSDRPIAYLNIKCLVIRTVGGISVIEGTYTSTIILANSAIDKITTDFWKHGLAGLMNITERIMPTTWYGETHPFEIEFVVNELPSIHKIFNNLQIISNNAEPDSFHYQIIGDTYEFADEKKNMYVRQEATKCLYLNIGSDITYNHEYLKDMQTIESLKPEWHNKSIIFPLSYNRQDHIDKVYDSYNHINEIYEAWKKYGAADVDYIHLAGAEVTYDKVTGLYSIWEHSKAADIKKVGRLRGNFTYLEDRFDIQINPLIFALKNENYWEYPPISIIGPLPNDVINPNITEIPNTGGKIAELQNSEIYSIYPTSSISVGNWGNRKETKLRDKCMRVRIRYSGKQLAIITSILTLYTLSYA